MKTPNTVFERDVGFIFPIDLRSKDFLCFDSQIEKRCHANSLNGCRKKVMRLLQFMRSRRTLSDLRISQECR